MRDGRYGIFLQTAKEKKEKANFPPEKDLGSAKSTPEVGGVSEVEDTISRSIPNLVESDLSSNLCTIEENLLKKMERAPMQEDSEDKEEREEKDVKVGEIVIVLLAQSDWCHPQIDWAPAKITKIHEHGLKCKYFIPDSDSPNGFLGSFSLQSQVYELHEEAICVFNVQMHNNKLPATVLNAIYTPKWNQKIYQSLLAQVRPFTFMVLTLKLLRKILVPIIRIDFVVWLSLFLSDDYPCRKNQKEQQRTKRSCLIPV